MSAIRPDEISSIIKSKVENYKNTLEVSNTLLKYQISEVFLR